MSKHVTYLMMGRGMSFAVAGRHFGVNRSMTHFVKKNEGRPGEILSHWSIDCVCLRELFLEKTERTLCIWLGDGGCRGSIQRGA
jgi:hypothetical protein